MRGAYTLMGIVLAAGCGGAGEAGDAEMAGATPTPAMPSVNTGVGDGNSDDADNQVTSADVAEAMVAEEPQASAAADGAPAPGVSPEPTENSSDRAEADPSGNTDARAEPGGTEPSRPGPTDAPEQAEAPASEVEVTPLPEQDPPSTAAPSSAEMASPTPSAASPEGEAEPAPDSSGGAPDAPVATPLSFELDVWPLFIMERDPVFVYRGMGSYAGCNVGGVCHGGETPGAAFSMSDREATYESLLEVPSVSSICNGTLRVAPGDPDNSCLILFYVGRLGEEDLDWVDNEEIELVRQWIRDGALP